MAALGNEQVPNHSGKWALLSSPPARLDGESTLGTHWHSCPHCADGDNKVIVEELLGGNIWMAHSHTQALLCRLSGRMRGGCGDTELWGSSGEALMAALRQWGCALRVGRV